MNRLKIRVSDRSEKFFKEIWNEYYPRLTVFLYTSFSIADPEDLVQEIMLKVFSRIESYNTSYSFNTWIYSIARNHAIDSLRKQGTRQKTLESLRHGFSEIYESAQQTPETITMRKLLIEDIADFINSLPETEREISYLRFYEGLKYRDIGRVTDMPAGTVKYMVHCIRKKFKAFYGEFYENG